MLLFPNCKINLGLDILCRRPDGFHDIETVMFPVAGLCDGLEIIKAGGGTAKFSSSGLPVDCAPSRNLTMRAWELIRDEYGIGAVEMHLHKVIPFGAGLGGGSADAAFAIKGLSELFGLGLSGAQMETLAARLGSDAPFFVRNAPQLCSGRGEVMSPVEIDLSGRYLVIVKPAVAVSTGEAYAAVKPAIPDFSLRQRIAQPLEKWRGSVRNAFEAPIFARYPVLEQIKRSLYDTGAVYASMSGSGSALFGIYDERPRCRFSAECQVFVYEL